MSGCISRGREQRRSRALVRRHRIVSLGGTLARPPRAQIYGGFHSLNGPIDVQMFTSYYSYQLNPKWLAASGVVYDLKALRLVANNVTLTRIGESFLTTFNFVIDNYKHNVGVTLMIQPRFANLGLGPNVPLAGLNGLE